MGLPLLLRLSEAGTELSSIEVARLIGRQELRGIGAALSLTKGVLFDAGIRWDEAVYLRTYRGRSIWTGGPRIRQAIHVLEQARLYWSRVDGLEYIPIEDALPQDPGPVLVLRALKSKGETYRITGGMDELDRALEYGLFDFDDRHGLINEIFIAGIEPGKDGQEHQIPDGYGENGIWVRGEHDYAATRVPGAMGTGRYPFMQARFCEATWVERRIRFVDARRQVAKVRKENTRALYDKSEHWRDIKQDVCFRYVKWIGKYPSVGKYHAPPVQMRLRCWYEIVFRTAKGKRTIIREEGLRGDDFRTMSRATERWRRMQGIGPKEPIEIPEIRVAKKQPRPMPAD